MANVNSIAGHRISVRLAIFVSIELAYFALFTIKIGLEISRDIAQIFVRLRPLWESSWWLAW